MRKITVDVAVALLFGTTVLVCGCQDPVKLKTTNSTTNSKSSTPSVGREYGETLHGAINQANEAKRTLEDSGKALGHDAPTTE